MYIIFIISAQNIDCGYSLEPPQFLSEYFHFFLVVKFSVYLNRRVNKDYDISWMSSLKDFHV